MTFRLVSLMIILFLLLPTHGIQALLNWILRSGVVARGTDDTAPSVSPVEIAKEYGYKAETHSVTTPDGYILSLHRVQNESAGWPNGPFILQHGLTLNSGQWLVLEPSQNLAFMLADNGYDVWMTNIRGNMYSRKHERLSQDTGKFWDYGWHEHGTTDMPAIVDYILGQSRRRQLFYAGHSMGTTMFFVMTSLRPEYNAKIKHMFALAPVAFCGNMQSPIAQFAPAIRSYQSLMKVTNNHIPSEIVAFQLGKMGMCSVSSATCGGILDAVGGVNPKSNETVQKALWRYFPDAVSSNQMVHYAQLINNPYSFRLFDYYEKNLVKYGYIIPPEYPVRNISAPMTFFYSKNDYLSAAEDVERFSKNLRNVHLFLVEDPKFSHFDYVISTYAKDLVYTPMLKIANSYRAKY